MMKKRIKKTFIIALTLLLLLSTSDITQISNEQIVPLSDYDDYNQKYT